MVRRGWKRDFCSKILNRNKHSSKYAPSTLLIVSLFLLIIYLNIPDPDPRRPRPQFSKQSWDEREYIVDAKPADRGLDELSYEFQDRIWKTQHQGCKGLTLLCGHSDVCGFGCQIHHRAACLMMSVSLNIPLIHNYENWPYAEPWNDIFYPLGSNCSVNEATIKFDWQLDVGDQRITFDLRKEGLPIPKSIHDRLKVLHPAPCFWVVGQFMKYTIMPSEASMRFEKWRDEIGLSDWRNEAKLYVRRTDKITEANDSHHELSEYVSKAESYFLKMEKDVSSHLPRRALLSSDDNQVLHDAKKMYSWWDIRGFNSTMNHTAYLYGGLGHVSVFEIFRDVFLLSNCDYLICGLSSNVCRLLLEIMSFEHKDDPRDRVVSLDDSYIYHIRYGHGPIKPLPDDDMTFDPRPVMYSPSNLLAC